MIFGSSFYSRKQKTSSNSLELCNHTDKPYDSSCLTSETIKIFLP